MTMGEGLLRELLDALDGDPALRERAGRLLGAVLDARASAAPAAATDDLLSVTAVARRLGVSERAVRYWLATGTLSAVELPQTSATGRGRRPVVRVRASEVARLVRVGERGDTAGADGAVIDVAVARAVRSVRR